MTTVGWRSAIAALTLLGGLASSRPAAAQQYIAGATAQVGSGIAGGAHGQLMRARTRLRIGADLRVDESPEDIFGAALLAEVEPHASIGADIRYMRAVGKRFVLHAGALGYVAPATLFGGAAGVEVRVPLSVSSALTFGPELNVFFLGSDLPDGTVFWQGLLQAGIHVDL
jgi:hypothetical protein